ncbi:MAG: hypothetical protein AAF768_10205 [Pseudomonadota bacterium]
MHRKKRILLLGDSRMAFPIAKALNQAGHQVFTGVSVYSNYLEWSRHLSGSFAHPSTDAGGDEALPYILSWIDQNGPLDAIQPVSESASRLVSRHRSQFEAVAPLIMPDPETVETCSNKPKMFELCEALKLPLAKFARITSVQTLHQAIEEIGFPLIIKPSVVDAELFGRKALIIASASELEKAFPHWPTEHPELLVQRYVSGPRHSVIFTAKEGQLIKAVAIEARRTHENDGTGYTTLGVTVPPAPAVRETTEKLIEALGYSSTGCTQFIVDPVTGETTFMELNPRVSLARISEAAGLDHSLLGLDIALNEVLPAPSNPWATKKGVYYTWTKGDLMRIKKSLASGALPKHQLPRALFEITRDAMRSHHAIFDPLDPMPALGVYGNFALKHVRKRPEFKLAEPIQDSSFPA